MAGALDEDDDGAEGALCAPAATLLDEDDVEDAFRAPAFLLVILFPATLGILRRGGCVDGLDTLLDFDHRGPSCWREAGRGRWWVGRG